MDRIKKLENENQRLKLEIDRLKFELKIMRDKNNGWRHPDSCLNNCDPWETWNYHRQSS